MLFTNKLRPDSRHRRLFGSAALLVLVLSLAAGWKAEASSYYGHRYRHHGGYWGHQAHSVGPYYNSPRLLLPYARIAGLGALELDLKPRKVEVYLDGRHVGRSGDFNGYPDYLWLEAGSHQLAFFREGYGTVTREYTVHPGEVAKVEFRMQKGESVVPKGVER